MRGTADLRLAHNLDDLPRRSARVKTVAAILDMDESQIRRLIAAGELQTHRAGKRGVRVFLDSVINYQQKRSSQVTVTPLPTQKRTHRKLASTAAHREAMSTLHKAGIV